MKMRFFSREWASGGLDDDTCEQTLADYQWHLKSLPGPVGHRIREFAETISLNDAWLDGLIVSPHLNKVELSLIRGDLQVGYHHCRFAYKDAHLVDCDLELIRHVFDKRKSEVWYDEFDTTESSSSGHALFQHRFLLWPRQSDGFAIEFADFERVDRFLDSRRYVNHTRPFCNCR